ncbi:LysR family transcriptional regulator [Achromobacter denitrificans]|uniref:LysR family transcriptional regulator n=1 Tax=Achromobacter denitrificans TaxID=32002 RepID=UPI00078989C8|nr:LysR family transcriptional regulator [Achromobacter denitrificans]OLU06901.1 LysR family transcriptional regulator [Achromobacter denitrificans]QKH42678.1 LysR family transcriptional regulator [Achromobacter denitrificans]QKH50179.1 LysR family transcriptional regulator [Achromobacter denitrificans]RSE73638.1 LysR family transcriptional regulator [Achromobacter denitrificans]CAB3695309.1 HTH-type transcriptional regulator CynR [Achromobacter denitrificans]
MDVRALRYFVETVRHASFTQAAKALFVTQSTVSKMIRQLEEEAGTPLLIRDGHTARPTDTGRVMYQRGLQVLETMRQLSEELRQTTDLRRGELEVGIPPMINLLFTPVVKRFRERHPGIHLTLREGTGQAVEGLVASGELEVGATILPIAPDGGLIAQPFGSYPIWVIGPPDAPWAGKTSLPLSALRDARLLIPTDDFAITRRLRQAFADAGFQPGIAAQSAHWDFLVAMASAGLGVALLPEPLMQRMKTRGLSTAKLAKSGMQWEVGHIWQQSGYLSFAARAWLEVCDEVLGKPKKAPLRPASR